MRVLLRLALLLCMATPVVAQSYPEVEALQDAFFATHLEAILKHLPPATQKAILELSKEERLSITQKLMLSNSMRGEGAKITRPEPGSDVLAIVKGNAESEQGTTEIVLLKRVSDGTDTVLRIGGRDQLTGKITRDRIQVWMRYVDNEWRVYEIQADSRDLMNLEEFASEVEHLPTKAAANESFAIGSLRTYNTALVTYEATFPDIGWPADLQSLGGASAEEINATHAGLLDSALSSPPFEKSGFRFHYQRFQGTEGGYAITARPIAFGTSGTRNFYTDDSCVIRFTEDDRESTASDLPLQ